MSKKKTELENSLESEGIVYSGFANKLGLWGASGGQLLLTSKRLIFTNRSKTKIISEYPLNSIIMATPANSASIWTSFLLITIIIKNSVRITLSDGKTQRFVVNKKETWIGLINEWRVKLS